MANLTLSNLIGTLRNTFRIGKATLDSSGLTVARAVTLPDKAGTVAMLSDITITNLGSFTSAALATALSDETGSGLAVFDTTPTIQNRLYVNTSTYDSVNGVVKVTNTGTHVGSQWFPLLDCSAPNCDVNTTSGPQFVFGVNDTTANRVEMTYYYAGSGSASNTLGIGFSGNNDALVVQYNGQVGIKKRNPAALLHLGAGTVSVAPLELDSGPLLTTPIAGSVEFLTDKFYGTITTGAVRHTFATLESAAQTFTNDISVPDEAYDATAWNGSLEVPTKNAVRDKVEALFSSPTITTPTIANLVANKIYPSADSTTAIQVNKADNTTNIVTVDTTNKRVGVGTNAPAKVLHVYGDNAGDYLMQVESPNDSANILMLTQQASGDFAVLGMRRVTSSGDGWNMGMPSSSNNFYIASRASSTNTDRVVVLPTGQVGVGVSAPTAALHLKAGVAAASGACMMLTSGVDLTTQAAGAVEYNGTHLKFTLSDAIRRRICISNEQAAPSSITVGASPYTYQNTTNYSAEVLIVGGTVSAIEFTRDNSTFYSVATSTAQPCVVHLSPGDRVKVTYSSTPTMTLIPR